MILEIHAKTEQECKIPACDLIRIQRTYVEEFFAKARYYEGLKRQREVSPHDPIVVSNALEAIEREGHFMRHCAVLQWLATHGDDMGIDQALQN
jgi:hypothetical protein